MRESVISDAVTGSEVTQVCRYEDTAHDPDERRTSHAHRWRRISVGLLGEEFAVPYQMFKEAGYAVDVATLGGIAPTVDKSSIDPDFMKWVRPSFAD